MKHKPLARQLTAQFFRGNVPMFALAVFAALTGGQLQAAEKRVSDQNRDFTAALSDCLGGFSVVKTFRAEKEIFRLFAESNRTLEQAALRRYDGILVLKNGRIAESGSFDELMEKKGYFYALFTVAQG